MPVTTLFRRGFLTTGGFGGLHAPENTQTAGTAGGNGGTIRITCRQHLPDVPVPVRFQDTALFTGGNTETTLGSPTALVREPGSTPFSTFLRQRPGSLGGRGARGTTTHGGDGGAEGNGGDVLISDTCTLNPAPTEFVPLSYLVFQGDPRAFSAVRRYMVQGKLDADTVLYSLQATAGSGGFPGGSSFTRGMCTDPPGDCRIDSQATCAHGICRPIGGGLPGMWGAAGIPGRVSCNALHIPPEIRTTAALACQ